MRRLTIRINWNPKHEPIIEKLQAAVDTKAEELGMPTTLEIA